ncbi:replication protein RepA [Oceanimonas baumannii]|uniref:RepA protein n=2 Tax=Oceanimonas baumannii TaxID=129578 RepID=A0ABY2EU35_9GAMM|nr:replication protein RepA [Oceanimonas baumannii]TDW53690.1 RepA protein [Oceanimonas baumannii]
MKSVSLRALVLSGPAMLSGFNHMACKPAASLADGISATDPVSQILAIQEKDAHKAGEVGFLSRLLIQATLPHSEPENNEWSRTNGNFTMHMIAPSSVGLPYGCYARLLLVWITTQAVRNKLKVDKGYFSEQEACRLELGHSLSQFMAELGLLVTGGQQGTIERLRVQMCRLFKTTISVTYTEQCNGSQYFIEADMGARVSDASYIWWSVKSPEQNALWGSWVELSPGFFRLITDRPVPLDTRVLKLIKRSPMALDVYCWATYRVSYLKVSTLVPWSSLMSQIGANYSATAQGRRDFKKRFLDALRKVKAAWPQLKATPTEKGLLLRPCAPHVARQSKGPEP